MWSNYYLHCIIIDQPLLLNPMFREEIDQPQVMRPNLNRVIIESTEIISAKVVGVQINLNQCLPKSVPLCNDKIEPWNGVIAEGEGNVSVTICRRKKQLIRRPMAQSTQLHN